MAQISNPDITLERVKALLHYDPYTGIFQWKEDRSIKTKRGDVAGTTHETGYVYITVERHSIRAHRLAWFYTYGVWPGLVDHKDGARNNNAIGNLRECSTSENAQNLRKPSSNISGYRGVHIRPNNRSKPFHARIIINGRTVLLGDFKTALEASEAYWSAKKRIHPFYIEGVNHEA